MRPVPAHLVEEVAREFQLDEIEPIRRRAAQRVQPNIDAQALLQNLDELLGRLREANIVPSLHARKEIMSRIHEALKKAEQERAAVQRSARTF